MHIFQNSLQLLKQRMGCVSQHSKIHFGIATDPNDPENSAIISKIYREQQLNNPYASAMFKQSLIGNRHSLKKSGMPETTLPGPFLPPQITIQILGKKTIKFLIPAQGQKTLQAFRQELGLGGNYSFCEKDKKKQISNSQQIKLKVIDIVSIEKKEDKDEYTISIRPHLISFNNHLYEGQTKGKKREGFGILYFRNNKRNFLTYEGQWKQDKMHGQGKMTFKNGDAYIGQWKKNDMNGKGTFLKYKNEQYTGQFQNGKKHGQGILKRNGKSFKRIYFEGKKLESVQIKKQKQEAEQKTS